MKKERRFDVREYFHGEEREKNHESREEEIRPVVSGIFVSITERNALQTLTELLRSHVERNGRLPR